MLGEQRERWKSRAGAGSEFKGQVVGSGVLSGHEVHGRGQDLAREAGVRKKLQGMELGDEDSGGGNRASKRASGQVGKQETASSSKPRYEVLVHAPLFKGRAMVADGTTHAQRQRDIHSLLGLSLRCGVHDSEPTE